MSTRLERRAGASRLALLAIPAAATLIFPTMAMAASGSSNTLRATIGGDGAVKSVNAVTGSGSSSAYTGDLPIKMAISRTVTGSQSTYTYHVENTFSKTQDVTYTDTSGVKHTSSTTLQLPLVAQLGVTLPKSFSGVSAPSAVVTTDADGTNRVLWNLVLFSPLGSPSQDLTVTVTGTGVPVAELAATAVNPATTSGLSAAQQDATASSQQDDFWSGYASGGNGGLTQLAGGTSQMIAGLAKLSTGAHSLNTGLKAAGAGANKLDAGTKAALTGSKALSTGIGQIHAGQGSLTAGLALIKGGLAQLDDKTPGKGVQAAVDGITAIEAGLQKVLVGLEGVGGTVSVPTDAAPSTPSVLKGLAGVQGAVQLSLGPAATGLFSDLTAFGALVTPASPKFNLALASMLNPASPTFDANLAALAGKLQTDIGTAALPAGIDPAHLAGGALVQANAGLTAIIAGLDKITIGLNGHTPGTFGQATDPSAPNYDPGGIDFGLLSLLDPAAGLPAAVAGLDKLATGSGSALTGSQKLTAGSGDALTGSQKLASGLGQLSAGQHQVATGLPAAVDGSGQIADGIDQVLAGAQKVDGGIRAVQSGAVGPLTTQLAQGSQNAKKQVAVVEAAGSLAAQAPGGAGTSYVLSQFNPKLAAATTTTASKDSHTARNVGLGLGGLVALVIAVTAGFALGRRSQVSTIA